jgi:hypothetical protein
MNGAPAPTGEWISQARFDHHYGQAGLDHDFGMMWGPHRNQRISLRLAPGAERGVLYVYDPLSNEYNILDERVTLDRARGAFEAVTRRFGFRGVDVDAVGDEVRRAQMVPLCEASSPVVEWPCGGRLMLIRVAVTGRRSRRRSRRAGIRRRWSKR